ncbi:MAG: hypothetical protein JWP38_3360 [Herbaspirillum sp.]|nr:hypothetical protein [Herbaspirillum sp.]
MNRRQFGQTGLLALAALGLAACGRKDAAAPAASPAPAAELPAAQIYELAATASGFSVGPMMAANTAYVFFDPGCPHCAVLWGNAKPLANKLRIVWIPVGFLARTSAPQGGAILAASDPVQAMNAHEARVLSGADTAEVDAPPNAEAEKKVIANTDLLKKTGTQGVPLIVYKNAKTGEYGSQTGEMETAQLEALLGV